MRPSGAPRTRPPYDPTMPGSFTQLLFHAVFSTKNREPLITPEIQPRLYGYIGGIVRNQRGSLLAIGGIPDHLHLLIRTRPDLAVSDLMRELKGDSSEWAHETFPRSAFGWQDGYAAFSVSASAKDRVIEYIENQEEHHRVRPFGEELRALLDAHGVEYDPRYLPV